MENKKVLITGGGGFIGSHVVEAFLESGFAVRALMRYSSTARRGHLDRSPAALAAEHGGQLEIVLGDVTDTYRVDAVTAGCGIVVHLAALIGIPYSYLAPASYHVVNATGTLHMLEAARRHGVERVIVTSTSEVYGTARYTPINEDHPLQAQSPYSASKIAADKLAESYFRSFDLPVVTLRPFNTYGPRQSQRAVITTVLAQALAGAGEISLGNLAPRRDVTFVTDMARAFVLAATAPGIDGETIHFGSGQAFSIGEIAQKCLDAVDSKARLVTDPQRVRPAKSEVECLLCDSSKAKKMLGWTPLIRLDEGLRLTAEYLRAALDQYRTGEYIV